MLLRKNKGLTLKRGGFGPFQNVKWVNLVLPSWLSTFRVFVMYYNSLFIYLINYGLFQTLYSSYNIILPSIKIDAFHLQGRD